MIRAALIAWMCASVPCSILLGRMCRATSAPLPGWAADPLTRTTLAAGAAR